MVLSMNDIKGIIPQTCEHQIFIEENYKTSRKPQRQLNPHMFEAFKKEISKCLKAEIFYTISNSPWVSPFLCGLKEIKYNSQEK